MPITVALAGRRVVILQSERRILPEQPATCFRLTPREQEVQRLLALRLTNKEIGEALGIGLRTTEHHVAQVLAKSGVASRRQIASVMLLEHPASDIRDWPVEIRAEGAIGPCPHCGQPIGGNGGVLEREFRI